jgi:hypothetical protein
VRRGARIDAYPKARRSDPTQRGERVTDHTISKELAVLRSTLQRAKRLGKFFGDLDAVFPSTGEFAPGLGHADGRMVEHISGRLDNPEDARSAIAAQFMGRFWYGNGGGSGAPRHPWQNDASTEAAIFPADAVRRGGIARTCTPQRSEVSGPTDDAPMAWASARAVVRRGGIEPPTRGFSVPCSTN